MEREGFGAKGDDDLDSLPPKATDHKLATATSAEATRTMVFGLERVGSRMRSCGDCGGDAAERISGDPSNQVEMIVAEDDRTRGEQREMGNNNDNDHSFEPSQTTIARSQQTRRQQQQQPTHTDQSEWHQGGIETYTEMEATQEPLSSSGTTIDQEGLLLGKRNEWSCMMQQIVESAESKLMRHRRVVEMHQQRQSQQPEQQQQQQQQQRGALDPAGMVQHQQHQAELEASWHPGEILKDADGGQHEMAVVHKLARINAKAMLFKSPAFATNTLDDAELDKLATSKRTHPDLASAQQEQQLDQQDVDSNEMGRGNSRTLSSVISGSCIIGTGATSTTTTDGSHPIEGPKDTLTIQVSHRQQHHEQKMLTDCDQNSSANMINRANVRIHDDKQWQELEDCGNSTLDQGPRGAAADKRPFWDNSLDGSARDGSDVMMNAKQVASLSTSSMETTNVSDNDEQQQQQDDGTTRSGISRQMAAAPDDEHGCRCCRRCRRQDQEDRGGPTPTNDLIRTLIHRDRLALLVVGGGKKQLNVGSSRPQQLGDSTRGSVPVVKAAKMTRGLSSSSASSASPSSYSGSGSASTSSSSSSSSSGRNMATRTDGGMRGPKAHRVVSGTSSNINEVQTTMIRTEMVRTEANLTIGAAHNNDTTSAYHKHCCSHCRASSCRDPARQRGGSLPRPARDSCLPASSKSERRNNDKCIASSCSRNLQATAKQTPSPPSSQVSFLELSGLSTTTTTTTAAILIGSKCHDGHLQLSPPEGGQSNVVGESGSQHQQPYQVTSHQHHHLPQTTNARQMVNQPSLSAPGGRQRQSQFACAYKFPLLLNRAASGSEDDDDDEEGGDGCTDDEDDEYDATYKSLAGSHLFDDLNTMSTSSGGLSCANNMTKVMLQQTDQLGQSLLNGCRLRPSVSSPSALSTPTNESGGCGDVCCSGPAQLSKLATENDQLMMADETKLTPPTQPTTSANTKQPQPTKIRNHCSSSNRKVSLSGLGAEQSSPLLDEFPPGGGGQRKRMGSNPLDRLRFVGNHRVGHWDSSTSRNQTNSVSSSTSSGYSSKRHSIISALTGSNRLSHPRSFFSGGGGGSYHQHQHAAKQMATNPPDPHLDPLEHHYDPLIPESGFKIVVMGTSGSGKTSIIQRFMYDSFSWRHNPTVEDTYFIEFPYMKNIINISISDTSGTYQFPAMRRLAISSGDAFILVYSVDDPKSFDELEQLRQKILDEREQAYSEATASGSMASSSAGGSSNSVGLVPSGGCSQASCSVVQTATSGATRTNILLDPQHHLQQPIQKDHGSSSLSPARHWSLASIFSQHNQSTGNSQNQAHQSNSLHSSVGSIATASSNSNSSSTDHSRRSSISAAEAALKTRRTRHPPMVIVANKYDLPVEKHRVNSDEIEALVEIDWNNGFVRASAALNLNIDDIFQQVLKQARQPPTLTAAIVSKRRKSLPPKLPQSMVSNLI